MEKRRMCPHCRAFITTDDKVCPYCHEKVGPRRIYQPSSSGFVPQRWLTTVLLTVNVALYLVTAIYSMKTAGGGLMSPDGRTLYLFGAKLGPAIFGDHQWWRLVTAGFLHGGLLHIGMNSWVLWDLGMQVENIFGTARTWVIYLAGSIFGFFLSTLWAPQNLSIGASAGLLALIGAMIALGVRSRSAVGDAIRAHYTRWVFYLLLIGLLPGLRIDNAAHLGGLAGGFAIAYLAGLPRLYDDLAERFWRIAAYAGLALTLISFGLMYWNFLRFTAASS